MTNIDCETEVAGTYPQKLHCRSHSFRADVMPESGSTDSAPTPHDYFDASLVSCKALTATWYAKKKGIPLDRVEGRVIRDASAERTGTYRLVVELAFHGAMTDEQRTQLYAVAAKCPLHKLMTTTDIVIETVERISSAASSDAE